MSLTILYIPISKGGANSQNTHHLAKSRRCQGLEFSLSDTKFIYIYAHLPYISRKLVHATFLLVNSANKCRDEQYLLNLLLALIS
jgi:hypothetical protein